MEIQGSDVLYLLGALTCALLYAFFVCASGVITRSRRSRLKELVQSGFRGSRYALLIAKKTRRFALSAHVGVFASVLGIGFFAVALGGSSIVRTASYLLFIPLFAMITAQTLKAAAHRHSEEMLCYLSMPMIIAATVLSPVRILVNFVITRVLGLFSLHVPRERELVVSAEEINELIEVSSAAGEIEEGERELIQGVFTFSDTVVREVMTPRKDVLTINIEASLQEVVDTFMSTKLSRIVVIGENLDDVKGVLIAKDLTPLVGQAVSQFQIIKYMRPAYFVLATKGISELLMEFRKRALHLAIVQDEHGGVDGVITVEDLLEEIVGEIFDEYDKPEEEMSAESTKPGELMVDGGVLIDDLNEKLPTPLPTGEYDTLAGYLMHALGHIPTVGDELRHQGLHLRVEEMQQSRVSTVKIAFEHLKQPNL